MMKILRDTESSICMDKTTGSLVSVLFPGASASPCCHWLTATRNPSTCLFKPFIFGPHADIGESTISPNYGDNDPCKIVPRFQKTVDRGHELYKGHEKLLDLLGRDDPTAHMVLQNLQELESNCIADVEEILSNYNEENFKKVAGLFKHMCDIEVNFYKMIHSGKFLQSLRRMYTSGRFPPFFDKGDNFCDFLFALLDVSPLLKKVSTLKGKNLLPGGANAFLLK